MRIKKVRLDDQRRSRFAVRALERDRDDITPPHFQSSIAEVFASHFNTCFSFGSLRSLRDCLLHSRTNPGRPRRRAIPLDVFLTRSAVLAMNPP